MRFTKTYEKFTESEYLKRKEKKEKKLVQKLGEHYIQDVVAEGDFEGLYSLLSKGFSLKDYNVENLLTIAIKNNQPEMIDYLINKSDYFEDKGWSGKDDYINSVDLSDLVDEQTWGEHKNNKVTPESVEMLKTITKLGYDFGMNKEPNLIKLYITENRYKGKDIYTGNDIWQSCIFKGSEPFIDWLLENYPENYPLVKDFLNGSKEANDIKKKYKYLADALKYNI
jgi:hypothetical protein